MCVCGGGGGVLGVDINDIQTVSLNLLVFSTYIITFKAIHPYIRNGSFWGKNMIFGKKM